LPEIQIAKESKLKSLIASSSLQFGFFGNFGVAGNFLSLRFLLSSVFGSGLL